MSGHAQPQNLHSPSHRWWKTWGKPQLCNTNYILLLKMGAQKCQGKTQNSTECLLNCQPLGALLQLWYMWCLLFYSSPAEYALRWKSPKFAYVRNVYNCLLSLCVISEQTEGRFRLDLRNPSLWGWWNTGTGCPEKLWLPPPWKCGHTTTWKLNSERWYGGNRCMEHSFI